MNNGLQSLIIVLNAALEHVPAVTKEILIEKAKAAIAELEAKAE